MFHSQINLIAARWMILFSLVLVSCQDATNDGSSNLIQTERSESSSLVEPIHSPTPTQLVKTPVQQTDTPTPEPTAVITPTVTSIPTTTMLFTGVIVPARCVQAAIDEYEDSDYLYDEVRELISQADLAVGTLNATISEFPPRTGCVPTYILVGGSENADALARAGFDLMSVATNHIKNCGVSDCGDQAFIDTLENLKRVGISPVGAGMNHQEAMEPVLFEHNGVRFGFVSLGQLEPLAFAGDDKPGIAVLDEKNLRLAIESAKQISDVVIVLPHWGPEDVPNPSWSQRDLAKIAVEAGADLVVGNHTHVVQAIETIEDVLVFYGLGNFVFDQNWARDHQQGVILLVTFQGSELIDYQLIPTHVDFDGRVHIAQPEEAEEILQRMQEASHALP